MIIVSVKNYGVLIEEWHLLARAVLVADADNKITYVEYLDNINSDPNYEAAVAAVKSFRRKRGLGLFFLPFLQFLLAKVLASCYYCIAILNTDSKI